MRRLATVGVTYVSLVTVALFAGCGDNKPSALVGSGGAGAVGGGGGGAGGGAGGAGGGAVGPACTITKPVITATHPVLNGVPVANGGDNVSSPGGVYEVAFEVTTAVEDGQPVSLTIVNTAAPTVSTMVEGTAMTGKATFAGVPLVPDGNFTITAACTAKSGTVGHSAATAFKVDSTAPVLTISSPADNTFIGPTQLVNGAFQVCAQTTSTDAVALPATLGAAANNLSVAIGTSSPDPDTGFAPVTAVGTDACVSVTCPSNSPVDLTVTLKDTAGNATVKTISGISCATTLPGVLITSPAGDAAPFSDPTKHLLAANSTNTLKDQDAVTAGAQFTVVACSDTAGMATLKVGGMGGTLSPLGTAVATVAAVANDNCPAGHTQVAKFTSVTLPDSALNADGTLKAATALEVDIQDPVTLAIGPSPEVDLWVASIAPTVTVSTTAPICNTTVQSTTALTKDVTFNASIGSVVLTATPVSGTAMMYSTPTFTAGAVTFADVSFGLGETDLTAVATDKAGNTGTLTQPCAVTVGMAPVVTFTAPAAGKTLCAKGTTTSTCIPDSDATMAGWQGPLTVGVTVSGQPATSGTVTFTAAVGAGAAATLGTAMIVNGVATVAAATIPDGNPVTLTATTSALGTNGVGTATRMLIVASTKPAAPTNAQVVVKDRRQTSFTVSWTAPAGAASYDLRYGGPIDASNFATSLAVPITGTPLAAGMTESRDVTDLYIETDYWFALVSKDAAGNVSDVVQVAPSPVPSSCTTPPCPIRASFNQTILNGPQGPGNYAGFGLSVDGSGNFVGDASSDIIAGEESGTHAYLFAGGASFAGGAPAVTFVGSNMYFGLTLANVGDIDGDGLEDIAFSSYNELPNPKVYIFKGRATWPAMLTDAQADYVITADSVLDSSSFFGFPIVKLGDINGDGVGDLGIGASGAGAGAGAFLVVFGATPFGSGSLTTLLAANRAVVLTNPLAAGSFGLSAVALGATSGDLVVSAPFAASGAGDLVAYKWMAGSFMPIGTTYTGATDQSVGSNLAVLGGGLGVIAGNSYNPGAGNVLAFLNGTAAAPLSGTPLTIIDSNGQDSFGTIAFGGGFSGSNASISYLGDSKPDLVVGGALENSLPPSIYIVDGAIAPTLTSPANAPAYASARVHMPADWRHATGYSSPVKDVNNDGYGDIAIGETDDGNFNVPFQGRVLVLW